MQNRKITLQFLLLLKLLLINIAIISCVISGQKILSYFEEGRDSES